MPQLFEDATLTLPNGDVYLFEDIDRLKRENQKPKAQAARVSMQNMLRYIFKVYPGFNPCRSPDTSCEEDEYLKNEAEKVRLEVVKGATRPTPQEWKDRTDTKLTEIKGRHGKDIEPVFFRISKGQQHIGSILLNEIKVLSITPAGVRRVRVQASIAIDDAENNNNLWQRLYAQFGIAMLKTNGFLNIRNDERVFKIVRVGIPDVYEGVTDTSINQKLLDVLKADPQIVINLYDTNDTEQDKTGFERVQSVTLR